VSSFLIRILMTYSCRCCLGPWFNVFLSEIVHFIVTVIERICSKPPRATPYCLLAHHLLNAEFIFRGNHSTNLAIDLYVTNLPLCVVHILTSVYAMKCLNQAVPPYLYLTVRCTAPIWQRNSMTGSRIWSKRRYMNLNTRWQ